MNKFFLLLILSLSVASFSYGQIPTIQWQKALGGSSGDLTQSIKPTLDGGYIVLGSTSSHDGDITNNHGGSDYWVVKLNSSGEIQWQKTFGGTENDEGISIQQTSDKGYIIAGYAYSQDRDVIGNHGGSDYWVVKIDTIGNVQWQKAIGGAGDEYLTSIQQTKEGGYIVTGFTDGNGLGHGGYDYWIVKLGNLGAIEWQKVFGGMGRDYANSIKQTSDGGFIVGGTSNSSDGDIIGNYGNFDYWIVKLNNLGIVQWQRTYGGNSEDYLEDIQLTADGGYILAGYTFSNNGNVSGNHGQSDWWIVKVDAYGVLQWQKTLGGTLFDYAKSIQQTTDGGYIVAGFSNSNNGDVSGNHGINDYWIVKLNNLGVIQWQKSLGGTSTDEAYSVQEVTNGTYIIAGTTSSNNGDISGNHGNRDTWIAKLKLCSIASAQIAGDTIVCSGSSIPLTAIGAGTYEWSTGAKTPSIIITQGGTYTVTITDANGCTFTSNKTVSLNTVTPTITGTTTICAGQNATLKASGGIRYDWSVGITTDSITTKPFTTTTYTVTVTNAIGCKATISKTVTVNLLPVVTITSSVDSCAATTTVLSATGGVSYVWSGGQRWYDSAVFIYDSGRYSVTATDVNGCMATTSKDVALKPVVIIVGIKVPNIIIPDLGDINICAGEFILLEARTPESLQPTWSTGERVISIPVTSSGTYSATVTNAYGCKGTASKNVIVNPLPTASFVPKDIFCGNNDTLTALGGVAYIWSNGKTTASIPITLAGNYTVTVTDANGCSDSKSKFISSINSKPIPKFTANTTFTKGLVAFTNASLGADTYKWNFGDGTPPSSSISPIHTYAANGTYSVLLVALTNFGCIDSFKNNISVTTVVATQDLPEGLKVQISPNPTKGLIEVALNFNRAFKNSEKLVVTDLLGRQVAELKDLKTANSLDLSYLPNGTYLLRLVLNEGIYILEKVVKSN